MNDKYNMPDMRHILNIFEARQSPAERLIVAADHLDRSPIRLALSIQDHDEVNIDKLSCWPADNRGMGYATSTMSELCKLANKLQVTLYLEAKPDEDDDEDYEMDVERLVKFYQRFGFQGGKNSNADRMMWRSPPLRKKGPKLK